MGNKQSVHAIYIIKEKLGSGNFATVKKAVRRSDKVEFAVKEIKKGTLDKGELAIVQDEVKIMKAIDHKNCVKLYEMYETPKKVYMILELLTGGELFDRIVDKGSFSEKEAAEVIKTLTESIKYLHGISIVHRDLKPENVLYESPADDAKIKITDFGLAKSKAENKMETACGTPGYVAPEVLKNEKYGPAVDLWSIGVIMYILLCGFPPFYHETTKLLYKQIKKGEYDFPDPYWADISDDAKDLVRKLLTVNPKKRATPDDVLAHVWISGSAKSEVFDDNHARLLGLMQARSRIRKGVKTIVAVNRFNRAFRKLAKNSAD